MRADYASYTHACIQTYIHTYIHTLCGVKCLLSISWQIQKDKMNTLVIVPLYPQYSISTSGSSLKLLEEIFYKDSSVWGPHAGRYIHTVYIGQASFSLRSVLYIYIRHTQALYEKFRTAKYFSCGSYLCRNLNACMYVINCCSCWAEYKVSHTVVPSWYYRPGYVRVMAKLILEQLLEFSIEEMREGRSVSACSVCT